MYENSKSLITITEELFSEFQQIKTNNYNYSRILSKTKELETYIVHKKWIYRQLREPGSLSISILLLLILAETSKMQPNNHCFLSVFWQLKSWVETVCFAQSKNILNATHIEFLQDQYKMFRVYYDHTKRKIKRFRTANGENEERKASIQRKLLAEGQDMLYELAKLFCAYHKQIYHNDITRMTTTIFEHLKLLVAAIANCSWYLPVLNYYFFFMFVKRHEFILTFNPAEQSIDEQPSNVLYPNLSFTAIEKDRYSSTIYYELFNDIAKTLALVNHADSPNTETLRKSNIWQEISGYATDNMDMRIQLFMISQEIRNCENTIEPEIYKDDYHDPQYEDQDIMSDSWIDNTADETYDIDKISSLHISNFCYETLSSDERNAVKNWLHHDEFGELLLSLNRILEPRTQLAISCDVTPSASIENSIDNCHSMLFTLQKQRIPANNVWTLSIRTDNIEESSQEKLELAEKYKEICDFFDIRRTNLSAVAMRKELNIPTGIFLEGDTARNKLEQNFTKFIEMLEAHRDLLYPQWFRNYLSNHSVISPNEQIDILHMRNELVRRDWTANEYIEFIKISVNKLAFLAWISKYINLLDSETSSKELRNHIAAAAFYQMISNLIYFLREEMLSLL